MRNLSFTILTLLSLLLPFFAEGQKFLARNYSTNDGMSHANVFRVFQDSKGFIWFCTDDGLSRFDGKAFHNYYTADGLSDNCIMSLSEHKNSDLNISTYGGGLCVMHHDTISKIKISKGNIPGKVLFSFPDNTGLWLIGQDTTLGLYYIKNGNSRRVFPNIQTGEKVYFHNGYKGSEGLFFCTNAGVFTADKDQKLHRFLPDVVNGPVTVLTSDKYGNIWLGLENSLVMINDGKIMQRIPVAQKSAISDILIDRQNQVWVSIAGLGIYIVENGKLKSINDNLNLSTYVINDLFEDVEGNIWIATHGEGVLKISSQTVINYPLEAGKLNVYNTSITPYLNKLVLGSIGTVSTFQNSAITALSVSNLHAPQYVYFARVINGILYIGTPYGLIARSTIPPYKEQIIKQNNETTTGIISIFQDSRNTIWAGGYQGIYQVVNNRLIPIKNDDSTTFQRINDITEDRKGMLWFATNKGLLNYNGAQFKAIPLSKNKAPNVLSVFEDKELKLWFGHSNGMGYIEPDNIHFINASGLQVNCFAEDKNNTLWIGTSKGLKYIDNEQRNIKDLYTDVFSREILALYCTDTLLYAGTTSGMLTIRNDKNFLPDLIPPPTYIISAVTGSSTVNMPQSIRVNYDQNKVSINFIGLNYKEPQLTEYRYKITNLDNQWHYTSNTSVELAGLPDGDFTFVLNSRLKGGEWGKDHKLNVTVITPLWKTWWFITITALLLSVCFYLGARYIVTRKEKKKRERLMLHNKMAQLKQQALTALINPHFIFNCMNSIQHYMNEHDNDAANEYLSLFSKLIRMTLEYSTASFIDLNKEISRIRLYLTLEQLRFGDGLRFELSIDKELEQQSIRIPNMILQPYMENAVWHGIMPKQGIGTIKLHITRLNDNIRVSIEDDGVGISGKQKGNNPHQSLGMKLISERLGLLEKLSGQHFRIHADTLHNANGDSIGTRIEITTPLKPDETGLSSLK